MIKNCVICDKELKAKAKYILYVPKRAGKHTGVNTKKKKEKKQCKQRSVKYVEKHMKQQ